MDLETTITVLADEWLTTKQAAEALNRDIRTVQKLAAGGVLKWKSKPGTNARLYEAADIQRFLQGGAPVRKKTDETSSTAVVVRALKPSQGERALDTVSIVGQMLAAQKMERELIAKNYETLIDKYASHSERVLELLFANQRADREDDRQRWELDRQERLERKKKTPAALPAPEPPPAGKPNLKARAARA